MPNCLFCLACYLCLHMFDAMKKDEILQNFATSLKRANLKIIQNVIYRSNLLRKMLVYFEYT